MVLTRLPLYLVTAGPPSILRDRLQSSSAAIDLSPEEVVLAYHERSKHHFGRYAAAPRAMDWATQPDPFRRYAGASLVCLPLPETGRALPYWQLYVADGVEPAPLSIESISLFFRYALSLTAWKQIHETKWPLRVNPSSGNLHPTEGYALLPALGGLGALGERPGVYHYAPKEHGLERRAELDPLVWAGLTAAFPEDSFLVGLSSVHWREAWKYGERAFRYCQHDVGHALGTMRFAAASLGWKLFLLDRLDAAAVSQLLGLDRDADYPAGAEREHPDLLALVVCDKSSSDRVLSSLLLISKEAISKVAAASWSGTANALSAEHAADWPVIEEVAAATTNPKMPTAAEDFSAFPSEDELFPAPIRSGASTAESVSAVSMDASTTISSATCSSGCSLVSYPPETGDRLGLLAFALRHP